METKVNFNVMECIETIVKHSEDSHLREPFFETVETELSFLSEYLQLGKTEAVFFACALAFWFDTNSFSQVFKHLGLKEYQILKYRSQIENLYSKNVLINKDSSSTQINNYEVSQTVLLAVSKNIPLKIYVNSEEKSDKSLIDILQEFDAKSDDFDLERIKSYEFIDFINEVQDKYKDFPFFRYIKNYQLSVFELFFLMDTIWDAISSGDNDFNTNVSSTVNDFYKRKSVAMKNFNAIVNKESKLTKLNLIELSNDAFTSRTKAKISGKMMNFLKDEETIHLENFEKENQKLIQYQKVKKKSLYYNSSEISSIEMVRSAISEQKFLRLQKRLQEKAMPSGITVLLHGAPGTGKTESVYQLARETKRNIFKVDISETKSMWFGESQKLMKKIFTDYQEYKEEEKRCPILLFNEADAVIGKRKAAGSSSISDTENAIQNVLLEELEKFDGILFATTNLVGNLDAAFERRFLYKIQFEKPSLQTAAKIWKSKLPFLKLSEAEQLTQQFPFSGGEMENIARKILMNEVLNGEKPCYDLVFQFCKEEKWEVKNDGRKIGF